MSASQHDTKQPDRDTSDALHRHGLDLEHETRSRPRPTLVRQAEMCADLVSTSRGRRLFLVQMLDVTEHRLRVIRSRTTHVDVSYAVAAQQVAENTEAMQDHSLLGQTNDLVVTITSGLGELTESIPSRAADTASERPAQGVATMLARANAGNAHLQLDSTTEIATMVIPTLPIVDPELR